LDRRRLWRSCGWCPVKRQARDGDSSRHAQTERGEAVMVTTVGGGRQSWRSWVSCWLMVQEESWILPDVMAERMACG
jgi:hypothetical protein